MKKTRHIIQFLFLALVLISVFVVKGNAEWWCPFGGVEGIYTYIKEGSMPCSLAVSNFYILAAILFLTLLMRRAFCGYMCPIGTIGEWTRESAKALNVPHFKVSTKIDQLLSLLKYVVLGIILFITYRSGELLFRGFDPCYALLSRHGEDITFWAYAVSAIIVLASVFIMLPFCRWFCPFAAVLNPFSRFGVARIKRDENACLACGECAASCPMSIPVDEVDQVTHARCMSCMNCIENCPDSGNSIMWGPPAILGKRWSQWLLILALSLCVLIAVLAYYSYPIPSFVKTRGQLPEETRILHLQVKDLTCRGRANLFMYYLDRDDLFEIEGYLKLEARPAPGIAEVAITYDPSLTDDKSIKEAITEAYFDRTANIWRYSPFEIKGYDHLHLDADPGR